MFPSKKQCIGEPDEEVLNRTVKKFKHMEETAGKSAGSDHESFTKMTNKNSASAEDKSVNADISPNNAKSASYKSGTEIDLEVVLNTAKGMRNEVDEVAQNLNNKDSSLEKCDVCRQSVNNPDLVFYEGHPQDAVEENLALTPEAWPWQRINNDGNTTERPHTNITGFSMYDQRGHLCPLDIVERDVSIFISGYLKPISDESDEIDEDSIPVKDVGPILEWFINPFDYGDKTCITLSTEAAEYNLQIPNKQYKPLMDILYEKIWISKVVLEYLQGNLHLQPTYAELIEHIRFFTITNLNNKRMTEELLHKHARYVCDEIGSLKTDEGDPLIAVPCMRELIELMGLKLKKSAPTKIAYKKEDKKAWTKATTTPLVRKTFESFFPKQIDKPYRELIAKIKRCRVCSGCQLPDCGDCKSCRAMPKFGGESRTEKTCDRRFCANMTLKQTDESESNEDADKTISEKEHDAVDERMPIKETNYNRKIKWIGEPIKADTKKLYYEKVEIDDSELCIGDFVMVETCHPNVPSIVAKIVYMWKDITFNRDCCFHGEVFIRSSDTVLGEVGDPREVFLCNRCCHGAPLTAILRKASVEKKETPPDWFNLGGKEVEETSGDDDGKTYFYSKYYDRFIARFEDLPDDPTCPNEYRKHRFCPSCERKTRKEDKLIPRVIDEVLESSLRMPENFIEWSAVRWRGYDYKRGSGVFLKPSTFKLKSSSNDLTPVNKPKQKVNEDIYTEHYRKSYTNLCGFNIDTGRPFCVGYITAVTAIDHGALVSPQNIYLRVNIMYRPENAKNKNSHHEDLNLVYWTDLMREIPFSAVMGPCHLVYEKNIPEQDSLYDWLERDPSRFYFKSAYDHTTGRVVKVPSHATIVGRIEYVKTKNRDESSESEANSNDADTKVHPLRTLDIFAGCGGLSEGLHQVGVAESRWAVEKVEAAAHAFSLNNKNCAVFTEDCNVLLREVMSGATHIGERRLPMRGEVELLCGGPPCQGFSGMNRFNTSEYSNFKNSLVASFLSYCDFYRPKFIILENVRNFALFKRGVVLKLTMRALLAMGYQCTFGVLQAGNYGIPQTRRRLIVFAAAPGSVLPLFPEPTHAFNRRACFLTVTIDGKRFANNLQWEQSAPRRTCTVRDAISDLPQIRSGASLEELEYGSTPQSHYQRAARGRGTDHSAKLRDHICRQMTPLVQARICHIPIAHGSDWRDLPNISVELPDGTKTKVLEYRYDDKRCGRSRTGAIRGVCSCASAKPCQPGDKQENTMIPWSLPHTGNRHNHWAGVYGRISWEGYFSTTVTDPEPMGTQGRVLHPDQPRVVSVRECARSQGFPDRYVFAGSLLDKHRQIGNAVPPPLAAALGREIKKAILAKT